jgi:hypothetical protein
MDLEARLLHDLPGSFSSSHTQTEYLQSQGLRAQQGATAVASRAGGSCHHRRERETFEAHR